MTIDTTTSEVAPPEEYQAFAGTPDWVDDQTHPAYLPEHLREFYVHAPGMSDAELAGFQRHGIDVSVVEDHERVRAGAIGPDGVAATFTEVETVRSLRHRDFTPANYLEQQHLTRCDWAFHAHRRAEFQRLMTPPQRTCEVCGAVFRDEQVGPVFVPGRSQELLPEMPGRWPIACADCAPAVRLALLDAYRDHVLGRTLDDGRNLGEAATTLVAAAIADHDDSEE